MLLENRPISGLIPYARNARTHSDAQVAQIAASIREFGFTNPVLVDQDGGIIAGHGRVLAARKLGLAEVPTITLGHLTEIQKRAYILADNKLALNAGWDEELLALELEDLRVEGVDLELTGFDAEELDGLMGEGAANPPESPGDFQEYDESISTDYCCPSCGYKWSGKANAGGDCPIEGESE